MSLLPFPKIQTWLTILMMLIGYGTLFAENKPKWYEFKDSVIINKKEPQLGLTSLSNHRYQDATTIGFNVYAGDSPLKINKIEWEKRDTTYQSKEPFSFVATEKGRNGESIYWLIEIDFPYENYFDEKDYLLLYTDRGVLRTPTTREGILIEQLNALKQTQEDFKKEFQETRLLSEHYKTLWIVLSSLLGILIIVFIIISINYQRRIKKTGQQLENISGEFSETKEKTALVEKFITVLQQNSLTTLNLLCDEYYEKKESDNIKISIFNEVEKHILKYRDPKKIMELQNDLNTFHDNLFTKLKEELPELNKKDLTFLTFLLSGFSPRAVCIFADINLKHFYYRRTKLKEMIGSSNAPDKELFLSKII